MGRKYSFKQLHSIDQKGVFFDANILIYLFWPTGSSWERSYSSIFKKLLNQGNRLFVDFIVLSEVVNRVIRIEYSNYLRRIRLNRNNLNFKQYRDSREGQAVIQDIYYIIKETLLTRFSVVGKEITKEDILSFLVLDSLDFSDKVIYTICKENQLVLFTNDKDFTNSHLDILSSNPAILNK